MDTSSPENDRLRAAVTAALNAHDLAGVLDLGAPGTSDGDPTGEAEPPTTRMEALAADLQAIQRGSDSK